MSSLRRVFDFVKDKDYRFLVLARHGFYDSLSDRDYMLRGALANKCCPLNIENPVTFNDKLAWLKLYDRKPLYTQIVDKYAVRSFVSERLGEDCLVPLVGGPWSSIDEIDFQSLPDKFVLKCTHDSGGVVVCKDKASLDTSCVKKTLSRHMARNFFYMNREWPYKNISPRIIAEEFLQQDCSIPMAETEGCAVSVEQLQSQYGLLDYKVSCFNGKARLFMVFIGVISNDSKGEEYYENIYDQDFRILEIEDCVPFPAPRYGIEIVKPAFFDEMIEKAELLSKDIPFARVDFYHVNGKVKVGEITLYPDGGVTVYKPVSWENTLGSWLELPRGNLP